MGMTADDGAVVVNHLFFADNGYFLADSLQDALEMFENVTECLYALGFQWKPSSLQIMFVAGGCNSGQEVVEIRLPNGESASLQVVEEMEVLGALVTQEAAFKEALDYRLSKGERVFRKYQGLLCGKGSHRDKLLAWESTAMASALHCSGTLALTKEMARHAHSWELRLWRQAFRLKPRGGEVVDGDGWQTYYDRSQAIIERAKAMTRRPFLVHRMLLEYFKEAWSGRIRFDRDGRRRTEQLRLHRSRLWWDDTMRIPYYHRRIMGWTHARPGNPLRQWEDVLVELKGPRWREWRDSFENERAWKCCTRELINSICSLWDLPQLEERIFVPRQMQNND